MKRRLAMKTMLGGLAAGVAALIGRSKKLDAKELSYPTEFKAHMGTSRVMLAIIVLCLFAGEANARRGSRRGYTYSSSSYSSSFKTEIDNEKRYYDNTLSMQDIAMIRAKWMAHYGSMTHGIHGYHKNCPPHPSGVLEGIGCGGPKCGTCTYGSRTCVADAEWKSKGGQTYRVRFFK